MKRKQVDDDYRRVVFCRNQSGYVDIRRFSPLVLYLTDSRCFSALLYQRDRRSDFIVHQRPHLVLDLNVARHLHFGQRSFELWHIGLLELQFGFHDRERIAEQLLRCVVCHRSSVVGVGVRAECLLQLLVDLLQVLMFKSSERKEFGSKPSAPGHSVLPLRCTDEWPRSKARAMVSNESPLCQ
jgi:hypothetical protein